jgi:hypothetical protein
VFAHRLRAGVLAHSRPMGLESTSGTGARTPSNAHAHHRIRPRSRRPWHPTRRRGPGRRFLQSAAVGCLTDGMPGGGALHTPTRWHLTLSRRFPPLSPGTAPRTRWQPARPLCCPHRSVSSLSTPGGLPGLWHGHQETAPRQCCPLATRHRRFLPSTSLARSSSDPVGRLGAPRSSAGVDETSSPPAR